MIQYDSQEQFLYFENLHHFFSDPENATLFIKIIEGQSMITLRQIEHFLKKYSRSHNVTYSIAHPLPDHQPISICIHDQYLEASKLFTTKKFDIFCRHVRLQVPIGGKLVETNIAQLNMFQWIIQNGVIEYMENHHTEIVADMYANSTSRKKQNATHTVRGPKTSKRPRLTGHQRITELPKPNPSMIPKTKMPLSFSRYEPNCVTSTA